MIERPRRFCMVTTFYPPYSFGGDGAFVRALSHELADRGHQVEIIYCGDTYRLLDGRSPNADHEERENLTIHRLDSSYGFLSPLATQQTGYPLFKSRRIRQILDKGFDVIHYHNISAVGGPKVLEYGRAVKLYTIHEYWLVCQTHTLFKYDRAICTSRNCITCSLAHRRPPQWWRYSGLLSRMMKHVDRFITPSRFGAKIHRQMGLNLPFVHLPHFVPTVKPVTESTEGEIGTDTKQPYFLYAGRLEKIKGLQTLIPLFRDERRARLLIAGAGNYELELRRLAEGLSNVEFLGHQSGAQLRALYRDAVAVVVPSICFELLSLVILEAFREGTPVVARNVGGMPELIAASGGGFVYDTEDELRRAMNRLLDDSACRERLGASARAAYRQNWTPDVHVERYFSLIREVEAAHAESGSRERA